MKKEYIKINSNCDGLPLGAAIYQPEADDRNRSGPSSAENAIDEDCIKGVVQFSHGMAEHKERYYPLMEYLAANGFASAINDHRGHGESVRSKEDRGYFQSLPRYQRCSSGDFRRSGHAVRDGEIF